MNLVASSEVWPITSNLFSVAGKTVLIYGWIARDRLYDGESIRRNRRSCFHQAGKGSANFWWGTCGLKIRKWTPRWYATWNRCSFLGISI